MLSLAISVLVAILPWRIKRRILNTFYRCNLSASAYIGISPIINARIAMADNARIGHFNVIKGLQRLEMGRDAKIGNLNYISAVPADSQKHFINESRRQPKLILEECACIVGRHFLDCSNTIRIGAFTTVAGLHTSFFTHGIDVMDATQRSAPIDIGRYCMIGTCSVILKGSKLPDFSILAANSTLQKPYEAPYRLYSGVPATEVKALPQDCAYFTRTREFVE